MYNIIKKIVFLVSVVLVLSTSCTKKANKDSFNTLSKNEQKQNWELLFNGIDLTGWQGLNNRDLPSKSWIVEDNNLLCTGKSEGSLISKNQYSNFELKWEWKLSEPGANSGIKYFVNNETGLGIEYQMIDDNDWVTSGKMQANDYHTTGAVYELYAPSSTKELKPVGEWNDGKIISKDGEIEHWLNGRLIVKYNRFSSDFKEKIALSKFAKIEGFGLDKEGHILLQDHESIVYFRNIKIRRL